ncbi:Type VI secretion lipoprotein/VasD [Moritella sp. JT01]|uniref:type VI secretion system lipoprotein TssJ n=1 Tax=Moritella sp. JT01 TaxID=756698 RepID=UPI00079B2C92|nr:type VI secretion system lipoprotein TssJ [Moritella sp. JT01]KXO08346.1 Type VI secretion lipoprotein/VasD [Moritella sp. JT01]
MKLLNLKSNRFNRIVLMCMAMLAVSSLAGCSMMNFVITPSTTLNFVASRSLNPDIETRPSPVVVKIFQLASRGPIETADFFSLYSDYEEILGPELLEKEELVFNPGQQLKYERELNKNTRFIAVLVAYQDIENSRWRDVIAVDPKAYDDFNVYLEKLSVFIRD